MRLYAWRGHAEECAFPQFDEPVLVYHTGGARHVPVRYRGRDHAASNPGQFTFVPQETQITWRIGGMVHSYSLHLTPAAFERLLDRGGDALMERIRFKCAFNDCLLAEMVETMAAEAMRPSQLGPLLVDSMVDSVALCLMRASGEGLGQPLPAGGLSPMALRRVVDLIEDSIESGVSLQSLANEVGLSRAHFVTMFRRSVGVTPHRHLTNRRIELAKERLVSTREPIAEIALDFGFSSQAHFTECFRRMTGVTPAAYRMRQ